jgi:hypothetical protein
MPYTSTSGVFNIYDNPGGFTVDPTGVNSSSDAINSAISAASTNGGGVVFIPPGTYSIAYTLALPPDVQLVGSDQGDTSITALANLRWFLGGDLTTVMITNSSNVPSAPPAPNFQTGIEVRDLTLNGNASVINQSPPSASGACIEFSGVVGVTIQRCTVYNCWDTAISVGSGKNSAQIGGVKILDNTIDVMATPGSAGPPGMVPVSWTRS